MRLPAYRPLLAMLSLVAAATAAQEKPLTADPLTPPQLAPSLMSFAAANHILLQGIDLAEGGPSLAPAQTATLLITLVKGGLAEQWLIRLSTDDLTAAERSRPLPPDAVIHTSTGRSLTYSFSHTALRVESAGPFFPEPAAAHLRPAPISLRKARAVVNGKFLAAGIAEYCRSGLDIAGRIERAAIKDPIYFAGSGQPAPADVEKGRRFSDAIQLSEPEERATFSVYFSLTTFFGAAMEIPEVRALLEEVVAKPSVWSLVRNLGVRTDFHYFWTGARAVDEVPAGLPGPAYQLPVEVFLNGKCGVKSTLVVASPRGPLTTCAGILALCAEHPTDSSRRLFIRVLAAHSGTSATAIAPAAP